VAVMEVLLAAVDLARQLVHNQVD